MLNPQFLNTLADAGTSSGKELLTQLFLFFLVAVIFFVLGYLSQQRKNGKGKWLKFVFGLLPVIACFIFSIDYYRWATDSFNIKATGMNAGQQTMYKLSPVMAIVFGIALVIVGIVLDRRATNNVDDIL